MLEIELIELQRTMGDGLQSLFMNFVTFLSGYMIANHYIGAQISKAQFGVLNSIYSVLVLSVASAMYTLTHNQAAVSARLREIDRTIDISLPTSFIPPELMVSVLIALMYSGSIYFAFTARKKAK